jgi:hypothetical protein
MKVRFYEFDRVMNIDLTAETVQEAAQLARLAMNTARKPAFIRTNAFKSGDFSTSIHFDKRQDYTSVIKR